jgi:hypothetical protein
LKLLSGGSSVVEHLLAKERVAGSSPVRRSRKNTCQSGVFSFIFKICEKVISWAIVGLSLTILYDVYMIDMSVVDINYPAVLVAAIVYMAIGMAWYSPLLLGNAWLKESGRSQAEIEAMKKKSMNITMLVATANALIMSYVIAHFVDLVGATELADGLALGFWAWLGYVMTVQIHAVLWDGRSWKFFLINTLCSLVSIIAVTLVLTLWA